MRMAIIGCGQLARMLALAGWPLGIRFAFLAEPGDATVCVDGLGTVVQPASPLSAQQLFEALGEPDVITVEKEAVDTELLRALSRFCRVHPNADALYECQNRRRQKMRLQDLDIPNTPHRFAHDRASLQAAVDALGWPVIVKSAEQGYDGRNQWRLASVDALERFLQQHPAGDWVVERQLSFRREISLLVVRSASGEILFYPPTENHHVQGVLRTSVAPAADLAEAHLQPMQQALTRLLQHWHYVGMLAMECFETDQGLLVNELAPRVHNSGHWTQQAPLTSQFENHLRAVAGWPLGHTDTPLHSAMLNLVGVEADGHRALSPHATLHWYNKTLRADRKLGHINLQHQERATVLATLRQLEQQFYPA